MSSLPPAEEGKALLLTNGVPGGGLASEMGGFLDDVQTKYAALRDTIESRLARLVEVEQDLQQNTAEALRRVALERQALENEKSSMTEVMRFHKSKVKLDVGGCKYTTSMATLTSVPDSMLGAMFSGRFHLDADESDGSFFIDRDGALFKYILNYLRDPVNFDAPMDKEVTRDLIKEAVYFGLQGLTELLQDPCYHFKRTAHHLRFTAPNVLNGALTFVGTGGGRHEWENPVEAGDVEVLLNDGDDGGGDPVECLCDHDCQGGSVENCYDGVGGEVSFTIHLRHGQLLLEHYLIHQEEGDDNYLREWVLEGSDDGEAFEEISCHIDFTITADTLRAHWPVQARRPYSFFRVRLLGPSSGAKCNFCITQVELWGWVKLDDAP